MPILRIEFQDEDGERDPLALTASGPVIQAIIGPPSLATGPGQNLTSDPADQLVNALIDTGATASCVDEAFAIKLGLKVVDVWEVDGVAGTNQHNVYMAKLSVEDIGRRMNGRLIGVQLDEFTPVILGRDFLTGVIMIYDGVAGTVTITN